MANPELDLELDKFRELVGKALAEGGTQPLIKLTDEELAVLDPSALQEVVSPTPHLSTLSEEQREWVLATALRSLVSRGAVEVANIPELDAVLRSEGTDAQSTADVDMRVTPEVSMALTLRRTAARALAVEQQTSSGSVTAFVFVHSSDLLLIEQVTDGGLHIFTLASTARDAARIVQALVDPFGTADRDGRVLQLDPSALTDDTVDKKLASVIDRALVVSQLIVLADEPGPLLTAYATDREVWVVNVDSPQAPTGITAQAVSERTLEKFINKLIRQPAAPEKSATGWAK
jgi:ABC-type histidine transport system ATPase subunit